MLLHSLQPKMEMTPHINEAQHQVSQNVSQDVTHEPRIEVEGKLAINLEANVKREAAGQHDIRPCKLLKRDPEAAAGEPEPVLEPHTPLPSSGLPPPPQQKSQALHTSGESAVVPAPDPQCLPNSPPTPLPPPHQSDPPHTHPPVPNSPSPPPLLREPTAGGDSSHEDASSPQPHIRACLPSHNQTPRGPGYRYPPAHTSQHHNPSSHAYVHGCDSSHSPAHTSQHHIPSSPTATAPALPLPPPPPQQAQQPPAAMSPPPSNKEERQELFSSTSEALHASRQPSSSPADTATDTEDGEIKEEGEIVDAPPTDPRVARLVENRPDASNSQQHTATLAAYSCAGDAPNTPASLSGHLEPQRRQQLLPLPPPPPRQSSTSAPPPSQQPQQRFSKTLQLASYRDPRVKHARGPTRGGVGGIRGGVRGASAVSAAVHQPLPDCVPPQFSLPPPHPHQVHPQHEHAWQPLPAGAPLPPLCQYGSTPARGHAPEPWLPQHSTPAASSIPPGLGGSAYQSTYTAAPQAPGMAAAYTVVPRVPASPPHKEPSLSSATKQRMRPQSIAHNPSSLPFIVTASSLNCTPHQVLTSTPNPIITLQAAAASTPALHSVQDFHGVHASAHVHHTGAVLAPPQQLQHAHVPHAYVHQPHFQQWTSTSTHAVHVQQAPLLAHSVQLPAPVFTPAPGAGLLPSTCRSTGPPLPPLQADHSHMLRDKLSTRMAALMQVNQLERYHFHRANLFVPTFFKCAPNSGSHYVHNVACTSRIVAFLYLAVLPLIAACR